MKGYYVLCFVGTDVSRLIGLIRLQQQQKQKQVLQRHRQQLDKQGSPELRMDTDPSPLSLSISTLTNRFVSRVLTTNMLLH